MQTSGATPTTIRTIGRTPPADFAGLLRRLRARAGLSQEALAERAGISVDAVSAYERGLRQAPRRETTASLADALQLNDAERAELEEIAGRKRIVGAAGAAKPNDNLPWQSTTFVGRSREIDEISDLLAQRRLVTITGAGGIGKTRTALEVASRLATPPRDGVWFVDLASLPDGTLVVGKFASALRLPLSEQGDALAALVAAMKSYSALIILDNCEHVVSAVRTVVKVILNECPNIALLATSREPLRISGERAFRLPALSVPSAAVDTSDEALAYSALELFVGRATEAQRAFLFRDEDVDAIADICRRLDGIALAIELAAARLPVLGLSELRAQLAQRFDFRIFGGGRHDLPPRQQTLHATIAWSYALLSEPERILLSRLGIFAGGWTLAAAESVCAQFPLERAAVLDTLFSLVEKSLVTVNLDAAIPRYSFFESTRVFARGLLLERDEGHELATLHARWVADFAADAYATYQTIPRARWETSVASDLENAYAALEWAVGPNGNSLVAAQIAAGLQGYWQSAGVAANGRVYIDESLKQIDETEHPTLTAQLLLAQVRFLHGKACVETCERAIALLERDGSSGATLLARAYGMLAHCLSQSGMYGEAERANDKAIELLEAKGLHGSLDYATFLGESSTIFRMQGRLAEASDAIKEAISIAEAHEDDWFVATFQSIIADIEFSEGSAQRAVELGEIAVAGARKARAAQQELYSLCNLACYQLAVLDIAAAEANAREAMKLAKSSKAGAPVLFISVQHLATVRALKNDPKRAARLCGYVDAWYRRIECPRDTTEQKGYEILMRSLREQLTEHEIVALAAEGAQISQAAALGEALSTRGF